MYRVLTTPHCGTGEYENMPASLRERQTDLSTASPFEARISEFEPHAPQFSAESDDFDLSALSAVDDAPERAVLICDAATLEHGARYSASAPLSASAPVPISAPLSLVPSPPWSRPRAGLERLEKVCRRHRELDREREDTAREMAVAIARTVCEALLGHLALPRGYRASSACGAYFLAKCNDAGEALAIFCKRDSAIARWQPHARHIEPQHLHALVFDLEDGLVDEIADLIESLTAHATSGVSSDSPSASTAPAVSAAPFASTRIEAASASKEHPARNGNYTQDERQAALSQLGRRKPRREGKENPRRADAAFCMAHTAPAS